MTKKLRRYWGIMLVLGPGTVCAGPTFARAPSEEMTVYESPFTIRQEPVTHGWGRQMAETRISVEKTVSYADLDLSKDADVTTMEGRIRDAARDDCRELDRRFPAAIYAPVGTVGTRSCVRDATNQALAQLDGIRGLTR
jgi:UrcA family protein